MAKVRDMTGQKFGKLTPLCLADKRNGVVHWLCLCDCGNQTTVSQGNLNSGKVKSCGCLRRTDFTGQRFGRLLIESFAYIKAVGTNPKQVRAFFNAVCDCGNRCVVSGNRLQTGCTNSCGCLRSKPGAAQRELYGKYITRSEKRGHLIEFSFEEFIAFVQQNCFYCDAPPNQVITSYNGSEKFQYNGIDRWDSNLEYTKDNMVPCCGTCNKQKLVQSGEEYIFRCQLIAARAQEILAKRNPVKENQTCAYSS